MSFAIIPIVLAHEIGHVLGLGHATSENALMYYNLTQRKELTLSEDDVLGVSYLYPVTEPSTDGAFGCTPNAEAGTLGGTSPAHQPWWGRLLNGVGQIGFWMLLVWSLFRVRFRAYFRTD